MALLEGKRALIVGIANQYSIATGIANVFAREGAELALTYQQERLKPKIERLAKDWPCQCILPCDVSQDDDIKQLFTKLKSHWSSIDIIVHAVAFAPMQELADDMVDVTTREGFKIAHDISSYSLIALTKAAKPMLTDNASVLTLSYLGSQRVMPNYNAMGLAKASLEAGVKYLASNLGPMNARVNAISAGPIKTLAASGIKQFRSILSYNQTMAPLRRNITQEDVGNTAAFLCSNLASGITGQTIYVDAGASIMGLAPNEIQ